MDTITVDKRDFSLSAKQLRRNDKIPGNVFGGALEEPIALQIEGSAARKVINKLREGSRLQLKIDGKTIPVQIKEKSVDILSNQIIHIGFQALKADQPVNSVVHVMLVNTDKLTASLQRMNLKIPYSALPADMIDTVTVDVDGMPIGTVLTVADIPEFKNEKIEIKVPEDTIILRVFEAKRVILPEDLEAEEEAEAAGDAEAAESAEAEAEAEPAE